MAPVERLRAAAEASARDTFIAFSPPGEGDDAIKNTGTAQTSRLLTPEPGGVDGKRFGSLTVIRIAGPATAKRRLCRCDCSAVLEISVEGLRAGSCRRCGCNARSPTRPKSFASTVATTEKSVAGARHRGRR